MGDLTLAQPLAAGHGRMSEWQLLCLQEATEKAPLPHLFPLSKSHSAVECQSPKQSCNELRLIWSPLVAWKAEREAEGFPDGGAYLEIKLSPGRAFYSPELPTGVESVEEDLLIFFLFLPFLKLSPQQGW